MDRMLICNPRHLGIHHQDLATLSCLPPGDLRLFTGAGLLDNIAAGFSGAGNPARPEEER
jgi:hypothetical protein